MRSIIQVSDDLEGKLKARFKNITLGNKKGEPPVKSSEDEDVNHAVFFSFDFTVDNENYGNVTIYLADKKGLEVLYSKNITDNIGSNKHEWFKFLQGIRDFAMRNMLTFHPKDISRDALDTRDIKALAKSYVGRPTPSEVTESKMSNLFGSKKSSYQNLGPVRLIVRHNSTIDETKMGARSRNIHSIYVETQDGERFKVPTNNLMAGRVMARHISNGGSMHDAFGKHVMEMVNQLKEMRYFVLSSKRYNFEDATTKDMVETAIESYNKVRETLHKLKGQRGYASYMESFTEEQQQEAYQMSEELRDRFVKRIFDERLSQAMPHVAKAYAAKIRESNMLSEKLNQFEAGEFKFGLTESDREMLGIIEFADSNVFMRKMLEEIGTKLAEQDRQLSDFAARTSANWDSTPQIQKEMAAKLVRSFIKEMNAIKSGKTTKQEATMAPPQDSVLKEGVWEIPRTPAKVKKLIDMLSRPLPAGTDGDNATNALYGVFGDDELFDAIANMGEKKPEADVRKLVINRLLVVLAKPENIRASAREIETIATALEQIKSVDVGAAYADKIDMILNKYSEYAQRRFDEQGVAEGTANQTAQRYKTSISRTQYALLQKLASAVRIKGDNISITNRVKITPEDREDLNRLFQVLRPDSPYAYAVIKKIISGGQFDKTEEPKIKQVFDNLFSHSVHGPFHGNQTPGAQPSGPIKSTSTARPQQSQGDSGFMQGFQQGFAGAFGNGMSTGAASGPQTTAPTPPTAPGTMANPIRRPEKFMGSVVKSVPRLKEQGVEEDTDEYQDQIDRFLAGGGKIQSVPTKPPRKSERLGGSRHIGGGGDSTKSRIRGISANTQGTKVIGLPEEGVADLENLDDWVAEDFGKTVKQGLKKIKRGVAGWGAFDKDSPQDLVKRNREYDDATVQLLRKGGDVTKGSPADLQRRVLDREAARRGLGETKTAKSK